MTTSGLLTEQFNLKTIFLQGNKSANAVQEKGFNFDDARLMRGAWRNEPNADLCRVC